MGREAVTAAIDDDDDDDRFGGGCGCAACNAAISSGGGILFVGGPVPVCMYMCQSNVNISQTLRITWKELDLRIITIRKIRERNREALLLHVNGSEKDGRMGGEYVLGAIAVMNVKVDNRNTLDAVSQQRILRSDRNAIYIYRHRCVCDFLVFRCDHVETIYLFNKQ